MSSSPVTESTPQPPSPALHTPRPVHVSTPSTHLIHPVKKTPNPPLNVTLPSPTPATPPAYVPGEPTLTPPPRSPGATPGGDGKHHPPDGTSSDKSSETAVGGVSRSGSAAGALSRKESYKAQRQHYRREKKRVATALLHSIEDPSVVVLADWLKVRGSLKSWTKLWCVLKPGLLLLYKSPKAKSSHWVGTVLLTSCQVIERPSKKDGFCFKLYHPLEQSIWAPRGPHNETIGAVVQPLPTAHLIFRAPSQTAGHCWLDGLELALRCSNAMLRCSRSSRAVIPQELQTATNNISHEELEKHFNEHVLKLAEITSCSTTTPLMSTSDYSPNKHISDRKPSFQAKKKTRGISKWAPFVELSKDQTSSDSSDNARKDYSLLDFLKKKDYFERNIATTSSMKVISERKETKPSSKSLASSPKKIESLVKNTPLIRCFEMPKLTLPLGDKKMKDKTITTSFIEENLFRLVNTLPIRRSSTPCTKKLASKRISELRSSGVKSDSENDEVQSILPKKRKDFKDKSEVLCTTPDNIVITKTAPSIERFRRYSSSSTDEVFDEDERRHRVYTDNKYTLIDCSHLPSSSFVADQSGRRDDRLSSQDVYIAGKIVSSSELAGAASDTDSDGGMPDQSQEAPKGVAEARRRIELLYTEDTNKDLGVTGELVEEVAEENKSLLWFLLKQVRPGMDLSKVVLPTFILEPRSFLDKLSDSYFHSDMLGRVATTTDPFERYLGVLRWYLSGLYRKPRGLKKPYNPVLGECFRCCWQHSDTQTYTYYVSEQVSHHPPVSAFYVSNRKLGYVIEGSLLARSKFYGNSTSAILEGCARVHLLPWGETYVTTAPYAHCKGIVIGTLSMELGGKVNVICEKTGYHADVEFKLRSFLGSSEQTNSVYGRIKKDNETIATVEGYWDGEIDIKHKKSGMESTLLDVAILKEQRLPRYLVRVDCQHEYESEKLWIKVSEAIENGDQVAATEEKTAIEEAQRARAKNQVNPWVPRFFHRDEVMEAPKGVRDQGWRYNHGNTTPWLPEEQFEYEDDFVIQSILSTGANNLSDHRIDVSTSSRAVPSPRPAPLPALTDSDTHEDLARRSKTSTRTLKQSLLQMDGAIREQTLAIQRLSQTVESLQLDQKQAVNWRPQNMGRIAATSHSWDIFGGFVLAVVLQALLNWLFYQKD